MYQPRVNLTIGLCVGLLLGGKPCQAEEALAAPGLESPAAPASVPVDPIGTPTPNYPDMPQTAIVPTGEPLAKEMPAETFGPDTVMPIDDEPHPELFVPAPDSAKREQSSKESYGYVPNSKEGTKRDHQTRRPQSEADNLFNQAAKAEEQGHQEQALTALEKLLRLEPDHHRGRLMLGRLLVSSRHYQEAAETLGPLLAESDPDWRPWFWSAMAHLHMKSYDTAARNLDSALARAEDHVELWIQRAVVEEERGKPEVALQYLLTALELAPDRPETLFNLAYASEQVGDLRGASTAYRRFLLADAKQRNGYNHLRQQVLARLATLSSPMEPATQQFSAK